MKSRLSFRRLAALGCAAGLLAGCNVARESAGTPFEALRLDGSRAQFAPDGATRAWVFVFVGADCPISNRYLPELVTLAQESAADGIRFVFVYPNADEEPPIIRQHQQEFGLPGDVFRDPNHELARRLGTHVTPEVVAITVDGRAIYRGRVNDQYLALGKGRPAPTRHDLAEALQQFRAGNPPAGLSAPAVGCTFRARP